MTNLLASLAWSDWVGPLLLLSFVALLVFHRSLLRDAVETMAAWLNDSDDAPPPATAPGLFAYVGPSGPCRHGVIDNRCLECERSPATPSQVAIAIADVKAQLRDEICEGREQDAAVDVLLMAWLELALERLREQYGEAWARGYVDAYFEGDSEAVVGAVLLTASEAGAARR